MMSQQAWSVWLLMAGILILCIEFSVPYSGFASPTITYPEAIRQTAGQIADRMIYAFSILTIILVASGAILVSFFRE